MLGKGRAEAISLQDYLDLANEIGCHPADLEAIAKVESGGFGWYKDGRMKILFEKHWFYKLLKGAQRTQAVKQGLARKSWISPRRGGYRDQKTASMRYDILERAMKINRSAALKSISMGRFQIMGFNHKICGFNTVEDMWSKFLDSEKWQLHGFRMFLKNKKLEPAMRTRNFARIEKIYNGGGLGGAYARRMRTESDRLRRGKYKNWKPGPRVKKPKEPPLPPIMKPTEPVKEPTKPKEPPAQENFWVSLFKAFFKSLGN